MKMTNHGENLRQSSLTNADSSEKLDSAIQELETISVETKNLWGAMIGFSIVTLGSASLLVVPWSGSRLRQLKVLAAKKQQIEFNDAVAGKTDRNLQATENRLLLGIKIHSVLAVVPILIGLYLVFTVFLKPLESGWKFLGS